MLNDRFGTIVQIGDILVSEDVISEYFACDYERCKGRCCIEGDSGAPLDEAEIDGLERDYPQFCSLMSEGGKQAVLREGFFSVDRDGDLVTPLVEGGGECAYSHLTEDGSGLCAIECCKLRKPLSGSLYPIRVTPLTGGGKALNLHRWDICADAFAKGRREGIRVYQFLHKPLVQAFGQEFYEALCAAAGHINSSL